MEEDEDALPAGLERDEDGWVRDDFGLVLTAYGQRSPPKDKKKDKKKKKDGEKGETGEKKDKGEKKEKKYRQEEVAGESPGKGNVKGLPDEVLHVPDSRPSTISGRKKKSAGDVDDSWSQSESVQSESVKRLSSRVDAEFQRESVSGGVNLTQGSGNEKNGKDDKDQKKQTKSKKNDKKEGKTAEVQTRENCERTGELSEAEVERRIRRDQFNLEGFDKKCDDDKKRNLSWSSMAPSPTQKNDDSDSDTSFGGFWRDSKAAKKNEDAAKKKNHPDSKKKQRSGSSSSDSSNSSESPGWQKRIDDAFTGTGKTLTDSGTTQDSDKKDPWSGWWQDSSGWWHKPEEQKTDVSQQKNVSKPAAEEESRKKDSYKPEEKNETTEKGWQDWSDWTRDTDGKWVRPESKENRTYSLNESSKVGLPESSDKPRYTSANLDFGGTHTRETPRVPQSIPTVTRVPQSTTTTSGGGKGFGGKTFTRLPPPPAPRPLVKGNPPSISYSSFSKSGSLSKPSGPFGGSSGGFGASGSGRGFVGGRGFGGGGGGKGGGGSVSALKSTGINSIISRGDVTRKQKTELMRMLDAERERSTVDRDPTDKKAMLAKVRDLQF